MFSSSTVPVLISHRLTRFCAGNSCRNEGVLGRYTTSSLRMVLRILPIRFAISNLEFAIELSRPS